ncbi:hypothetical protein Bhyg_13907, partial [Pseudolycoriella hygida]
MDKPFSHSQLKKYVCRYMLVYYVMFIIFTIYSGVLTFNPTSILQYSLFTTSYVFINGTYAAASSLYSFLVLGIKLRYAALNDCLRCEGHLLSVTVAEYGGKKTTLSNIAKIAQLHDNLTDIIGL